MLKLIYDVFVDATRKHANDTVEFPDDRSKAIAVTMIVATYDIYLAREMECLIAQRMHKPLVKDGGGLLLTPAGLEVNVGALKNDMYNSRQGLARLLYKIDEEAAREVETARKSLQEDIMDAAGNNPKGDYQVVLHGVKPFMQRLAWKEL